MPIEIGCRPGLKGISIALDSGNNSQAFWFSFYQPVSLSVATPSA